MTSALVIESVVGTHNLSRALVQMPNKDLLDLIRQVLNLKSEIRGVGGNEGGDSGESTFDTVNELMEFLLDYASTNGIPLSRITEDKIRMRGM